LTTPGWFHARSSVDDQRDRDQPIIATATLHWLPLLQRIIFSLTLRWSCVRLRQLKMQDLEYAGRGNKNKKLS